MQSFSQQYQCFVNLNVTQYLTFWLLHLLRRRVPASTESSCWRKKELSVMCRLKLSSSRSTRPNSRLRKTALIPAGRYPRGGEPTPPRLRRCRCGATTDVMKSPHSCTEGGRAQLQHLEAGESRGAVTRWERMAVAPSAGERMLCKRSDN